MLKTLKKKNISIKKNSWKTRLFIYGLLIVPIIHWIVFWLYLNIDTVTMTFQSFNKISGEYYFVGLRNYKDLFKWVFRQQPNKMMLIAIKNSLSITLWLLLFMRPLAMVTAWVIYKKVPLGSVFKVIFFLPNLLSDIVMVLLFQLMLDPDLGLVQVILDAINLGHLTPSVGWFGSPNTAWWLILFECLWAGIGYDSLLFFAAFNRVPIDIYESAKLDGAGPLREFLQIGVPLIGPTISTLIITGAGTALSFFTQPLLLTNGKAETTTIMLTIMQKVQTGSQSLNEAATIGIFFSLIFLPIVFGIRKLVEAVLPSEEY